MVSRPPLFDAHNGRVSRAIPTNGHRLVTHLSEPWLNVVVAEPDLARIRIGQEARVATDDGQSRTGG